MHQISAVENPAHRADDFYDEKLDPQDQWYDDLEGIGDPPDAGKMVDDQSDISDYEDQLKGRKRKKRDSVKVRVLCLQHCTPHCTLHSASDTFSLQIPCYHQTLYCRFLHLLCLQSLYTAPD